MVGLLPLAATTIARPRSTLARLPEVAARLRWFLTNKPEYADVLGARRIRDGQQQRLLSVVGPDQLLRILARMLDEDEFLSPYGLRTLSRAHLDAAVHGRRWPATTSPSATSRPSRRTGLFGGNSNWRGPVWFPVNYLIIEALRRYAEFFGDDLLVEYPTGSGEKLHARRDRRRPVAGGWSACSCSTSDGRRPVLRRRTSCSRRDPRWRDLIPFYEYFHGDTGAGPGRLAPDRLDRAGGRPRS